MVSDAGPESGCRATQAVATKTSNSFEDWLESHLDLVVFIVVAVGFSIRAVTAGITYFNSDEALHFLLANQSTVIGVYTESLTNAHPPLFFFLLYFWSLIGNTEFSVRLLSVLAGTVSLGIAFKWLGGAFGQTAGFIGLMTLAFSPQMVSLSAEVRGYAVLLLFMFFALYFLERALKERSPVMIVLFSLFLYLAILTHYSTLWFTFAVGIYVIVRVFRNELPKKVLRIWLGFQAGAVALYAFLYVTHISKLRTSDMEHEAVGGWLRTSYFHPGEDSLLLFALKGSVNVFKYLFASRTAGIVMLLLFLAGVTFLLARRLPDRQSAAAQRDLGILLLLPFVIGCLAAIAGFYPYGGTRHVIFLIPFAIAGVGVMLAQLVGKRLWPVVLAAFIIVPGWNMYAFGHRKYIDLQNQRLELMSAAMQYIRQFVPPGEFLFVDYQTSLLLSYYLGSNRISRADASHPGFLEFGYGGYRVVSTTLWLFTAENFGPNLSGMIREYGLNPGERIWVVDAGSGNNLHAELRKLVPRFAHRRLQIFGKNIAVFEVTIAP